MITLKIHGVGTDIVCNIGTDAVYLPTVIWINASVYPVNYFKVYI